MKIKKLGESETKEITSLEDALGALDATGCACNRAYLIDAGVDQAVFVYSALIFGASEQRIERPDNAPALKEWLTELFDPYLDKATWFTRSTIDVEDLTFEDACRRAGGRNVDQTGNMHINMTLNLRKEFYKTARVALAYQADSTKQIDGTTFYLD